MDDAFATAFLDDIAAFRANIVRGVVRMSSKNPIGKLPAGALATTDAVQTSYLTETMSFADFGIHRRSVNGDLRSPTNAEMLRRFGAPRRVYDQKCRLPTNPHLLEMIVQRDVGPFEVRGLAPAVEIVTRIFTRIRWDQPDLYRVLGSAGMLCCRYMRGSSEHVSNHAWGTAIDLRIDGRLDVVGDGKAMRGLFGLYQYFLEEGFFWGAAFPVEDSMHFEASEQLLQRWQDEGRVPSAAADSRVRRPKLRNRAAVPGNPARRIITEPLDRFEFAPQCTVERIGIDGFECLAEFDSYTARDDLDRHIQQARVLPLARRISQGAVLFLNRPYVPDAAFAPLGPDQFRFSAVRVSCATLMYNILAMAFAEDVEDMLRWLYRLTYHYPEASGLSNTATGNFYSFPPEALMRKAQDCGMLTNATRKLFPGIVLRDAQLNVSRMYGRLRGNPGPMRGDLVRLDDAAQIADANWNEGDLVLAFRNGPDGSFDFIHALIVLPGEETHYIHATPHFIWPRECDEGDLATGWYFGEDPLHEMLGVSFGCIPSSPQIIRRYLGKLLFSYDIRARRSLPDFCCSNFAAIAVLRVAGGTEL